MNGLFKLQETPQSTLGLVEKPYLQRNPDGRIPDPPRPHPDFYTIRFRDYGQMLISLEDQRAKIPSRMYEDIRKKTEIKKLFVQYVMKYIVLEQRGALKNHLNKIKNKPSWFDQALNSFDESELTQNQKKAVRDYIDALIEYRDFWKGGITDKDVALASQQLGFGSPYGDFQQPDEFGVDAGLSGMESTPPIPDETDFSYEPLPSEQFQPPHQVQPPPTIQRGSLEDILMKVKPPEEPERQIAQVKSSYGIENMLNRVMGKRPKVQETPQPPEQPPEQAQPSQMRMKKKLGVIDLPKLGSGFGNLGKTGKKTSSPVRPLRGFTLPKIGAAQLPKAGNYAKIAGKKTKGKSRFGFIGDKQSFITSIHSARSSMSKITKNSTKNFNFSNEFTGIDSVIPRVGGKIKSGRYGGQMIKEAGILKGAVLSGVKSIDIGGIRNMYSGDNRIQSFKPRIGVGSIGNIGKKKKVIEIPEEEIYDEA